MHGGNLKPIEFHVNPPNGSCDDIWKQTDGATIRYHFSRKDRFISICRQQQQNVLRSSQKSARYFQPTSTKSDLFHRFQTKVVEKIETHILCPVTFSFENRAVYEMVLKNNVELGGHVTIWRMRTACWIPNATNTVCNSYCLPHCNNRCKNAPQCYVIRKLPDT
jgi:GH35 family endo-1,4-beta-xylanase